MSRIATCMQALQEKSKKALIPYIVAGDPHPDITVPMMHELVAQGADILEIGIPFSDPMAEGPVIQLAHERALEFNVSLTDILGMVGKFRETDLTTPVVLMGYINPVAKMGYEHFAKSAKEAGVDGLLTVDMPPEEANELNNLLKAVGIDSIFLIAPTTTPERIKHIADLATGYLYYVSLKGVTGAGNLDIDSVKDQLKHIKAVSPLPVVVGFGIKDSESARAISQISEGVVVGSALVNRCIECDQAKPESLKTAAELIGEMRNAMDAL